MKTTTTLLAGAAVLTAATATWLPAVSAEAASGGSGVHVGNAETVQVYLDPSGQVGAKRVYEQLELVGRGHVDMRNPVSTDHLRNLDGFSGLDVKNGAQVIDTDVDGRTAMRSVSNYDGTLPLRVTTHYKLDGKTVQPGDIVGADGHLEVSYTVENVTGQPQELSYDDGHGGTITKTLDVPIPMVATLETTAPASFDDVQSTSANMGGDGHGGTQMNFTMTLFPPIGSTTAVVGYSADIHEGVVPRAELTALPVDPLQSPVFKSAASSYQGGADSGIQLTEGASKIDTNLLRLRDGAAKLLAGLIKLDDGAAQLRDGLAGQAAPGAAKLADGAGQLDSGLGKLADGASALHAGTAQAAAGSTRLADGSQQLSGGIDQLADGQKSLQDGLTTLYDGVKALPQSVQDQLKTNPDYQSALLGLQLTIFGIGKSTDAPNTPTLLGGINAVQYALRAPGSNDCAKALAGGTPLQCGALDMVDLVAAQLKTAGSPLAGALSATTAKVDAGLLGNGVGLDKLRAGLSNPASNPATCAETIGDAAHKCGVAQVLEALQAGIPTLVDQLSGSISKELLAGIGTPTKGCDPTATLRCGAAALSDGVDQLLAGANALAGGAGALSSGLGQINDGAGQLADGAQAAKDGSGQVADGAQQLSDGIGAAADGSEQLADGLDQARGGAPKLVDGAQQLSDKGTKKLVGAGESTAQDYGQMVAVLNAGAKRAQTQSMALGAPSGAAGLTAYDYVITGADGANTRNLARGLAGGALLAAAGGVLFLRRRFV